MQVPINNLFLEQHSIQARYYYNIGGRWSGKTWGVLGENLLFLLRNKNVRVAAIRKTYQSIRNTLFDDFIDVIRSFHLEEGKHYTYIKSPLYIKFFNGSDVIFKGANDPEQLKGLAGVHRAILEEVNEFNEMDFETIDNGLRGKGHEARLYLMHNPVPRIPGSVFWFERLFSSKVEMMPGKNIVHDDKNMGTMVLLKTTYKDNVFCPESVIKKLEGYKETNPALYALWAMCDYTEVEGVILTNWDIVQEVPEGVDLIGYGLDFGYSIDPDALVRVHGRGAEIWVEGLIYNRGQTGRDLAEKMKGLGISSTDTIIGDSSDQKSIEEIYRAGFRGVRKTKKAANYKTDMANVLRSYKIHLLAGDTDLQREFSTWSWAKDKNGKDIPKPADGEDHYIDAMIMLLYTKGYHGADKMHVADISFLDVEF